MREQETKERREKPAVEENPEHMAEIHRMLDRNDSQWPELDQFANNP